VRENLWRSGLVSSTGVLKEISFVDRDLSVCVLGSFCSM